MITTELQARMNDEILICNNSNIYRINDTFTVVGKDELQTQRHSTDKSNISE